MWSLSCYKCRENVSREVCYFAKAVEIMISKYTIFEMPEMPFRTKKCSLALTNKEVRLMFEVMIHDWFLRENGADRRISKETIDARVDQ